MGISVSCNNFNIIYDLFLSEYLDISLNDTWVHLGPSEYPLAYVQLAVSTSFLCGSYERVALYEY